MAARVWLGPLAVLSVLLIIVGCKATTTGSAGPDKVYLAPEYATLKLESLAYLGMASLVPNAVAIQTADALVRSYLTGGQQKFIVVDESTVRMRAAKESVEGDLDGIIRAWKNDHAVDKLAIKSLGQNLGFDGFIFADLTQWREERVEWTSEGNSFTEVGMQILIHDARTGVLAWKGQRLERQESIHYRHGSGVGSGVYRDEAGVERTERGDRIVPPPPPAEKVAEAAVKNIILGLPDRPGASGSEGK